MNQKLFKICMTGLLGAMIFVVTRFLPAVPLGNQGYANLGDTIIFLSVLLLPTPYACIAASLGAALSDLTYGYVLWVVPTLIIKPLIVLCATLTARLLPRIRDLAIALSGLVGVLGYYWAEVLLIRFFIDGGDSWHAALIGAAAGVWGNLLQAVVCGVLFFILAKVARRIPSIKKYIIL